MSADIRIHQPGMEASGIERRIKRDRMLACAGGVEIIALAAHCNDERIVAKAAPRRDFVPLIVNTSRKLDLACLAIETDHFSDAIVERVPVRLCEEIDFVHREIHGTGCNLMQQRLPKMSARFVD